jgi:uncharacterized protein (TIGR03435 family)
LRLSVRTSLIILTSCWGFSQTAPPPEFEVASVKENKSGDNGIGTYPPRGQTYSVRNVPLALLIENAYAIQDYQLSGAADWVKNTRYDINAKAAISLNLAAAQPFVRTLLEDRFKLRVHHETRQGPVFKLEVAKGGSKLRPDGNPGTGNLYLQRTISVHDTGMAQFAYLLTMYLRVPVLDDTGLMGTYGFKLEWAADAAPMQDGNDLPLDPGGPSIFTAVQEQLGLKLQPAKGPVDYLIIDHVERPSEN